MNVQIQGRVVELNRFNVGTWFWEQVDAWRGALVPLAYLLLALTFAWPLPLHLSTAIPAGGDGLLFLWDLWWFRYAAEHGVNPFYTTMLYYPYGVTTVFTTLASFLSAVAVPLQWLGLNAVACFNLLLLLSSVAGAWATWALVRRITGSSSAGFVAGIAYGWSPYHSARVVGGHLNLASHQWLPLYILGVLGLIDTVWPGATADTWQAESRLRAPSTARSRRLQALRWALLSGLALAATVATELTYAAFLALWTVGYLLYRAYPLWRTRAWSALREAVLPLLAVVMLAVALTSPVLYSIGHELLTDRTGYMYNSPLETLIYSADLLQYVIPNEYHPLVTDQLRASFDALAGTPNVAERVVAPGWTVLVLATLGAIIGWRRRGIRFWWLMLGSALLLSIGPVLHLAGRVIFTKFNVSILLPYALLYSIPGFAVMRAPLRFAVLVSLAAAVLVGYTLAQCRIRWPRLQLPLLVLAGVLIVAESLTSMPLTTVGRSDVATVLRDDPTPGAVLDLPLEPHVDYLWLQTQHGRPIVGGYLARQPLDPFVEETPAVHYFIPTVAIDDTAAIENGTGRQALQEAGVRYVVVHWWAMPQEERQAMAQKLGLLFGELPAVNVPHEATSYYLLPTGTAAQQR